MSNRVDYEQVAEKLDYAAVDKKLAQLAEREPPRKRKTVADVLVSASIRVLAIFVPLTLPLVLHRNAIHIEPALNPHPSAMVATESTFRESGVARTQPFAYPLLYLRHESLRGHIQAENSRHGAPVFSHDSAAPLDKLDSVIIFCAMEEQETLKGERESQVSVREAARALGVDSFTLYSLIQRDRVIATRSPSGEITIAEAELARLTSRQRSAAW